jgi:CubicO group peptidase (beta-lactamase class C family)
MIVEKVTGQTVEEYLQEHIWEPFGMTYTFATKPNDSLGFIAVNETNWNISLGYMNP